ncbi:MAG: HAMP domain-containing protein [Schleiferiaceae bacterium]|jgi:class 3 adenylate cyclase/HAMP domain-containing protein|nr:HAMP domain-containing protein [Schleiferiaceae bacterium]
MRIGLTRRIWLTVAAIVLIFTVLVLYIVPNQQEIFFTQKFNQEAENLARTVALGVSIALDEQNFKGVAQAIDFAKKDERLEYIAWLVTDTIWDENKDTYTISREVQSSYPPDLEIDINFTGNESVIVKEAPYVSKALNGVILLGFNTQEIKDNMNKIRYIAIIVSIVVFVIGILLGLWLAKTISNPVIAIRDAALKVGQGDLTQKIGSVSNDEIGELSKAFNKMVDDLADAEDKIQQKNKALQTTLIDLEEKNDVISKEKKKSDNLLLNILPEKTAEELKTFGVSKPTHFDEVTVMFIDFAKFTQIAEQLSAEELVEEIDFCFRKFDAITLKHRIEKIKTIGDAYLCVGGLPEVNNTHAKNCLNAALEIQEFLERRKQKRKLKDLPFFEARIGMHTGQLVAGIVGLNKFAYDIWGDTVNTAARMESSSKVGKINITTSTYEKVKDDKTFTFEYRGEIEAKNKGVLKMYFASKA